MKVADSGGKVETYPPKFLNHKMPPSMVSDVFFRLAHTCLCAVTITKVFDTSVKRSVDCHLH